MSLEVPDSGTRLELDYVGPTERDFSFILGRWEVDLTIWFCRSAVMGLGLDLSLIVVG